MNLEIWEEGKTPEEQKNTDSNFSLYLRLIKSSSGIKVCVVDREGEKVERGNILELRPSGFLFLYQGISKDFGFALNARGDIKEGF